MSNFPLQGGCHCRQVRYRLLEPALSVQHCHCERCRKIYGAMIGTGAVVRRRAVEIIGAEHLKTYRSSPSYAAHFCGNCGCHLFEYEDSEAEIMYVLPATLDGGAHPGHPDGKESHIFMRSKAVWDRTADDLPKYETTSPDEIITGIQKA